MHREAAAALVLLAGVGIVPDAHAQAAEAPVEGQTQQPASIPVAPEAAPAAATPSPSRPTNRFIEEVVVTAQKREENLQDVPISVSAFSADTLDAKGVTNPMDLPMVTPGLTYTSLVSYSMIYIRGVGTDAFIPSFDMSVATYVDGIYMPYASGLAQSFGSLERIEVLKGPQGTLFGRNTTGGALNIVTKKPSLTGYEAIGSVSYGRYDDLQTKAHVNIPMTDWAAVSVSGLYNRRDPYYKSLNQPLADEVSKGARVKLRVNPFEDLDLILSAMKIQSTGPGSGLGANIDPSPMIAATGQTPPPDYVTEINDPAYNNNATTMVYLDGTWKLSALDTRVILADQRVRANVGFDFDATSLPLATGDHPKGFSDLQTAEVQLLSNADSWGSDWLTYIGGYYYLHSEGGYDPLRLGLGIRELSDLSTGSGFIPPIGQTIMQGLLESPAGDVLQNILDPLLPPNAISVITRGIVETKAHAVFLQGTARINDWFSVTAGARYQEEKRALIKSTMGVNVDAFEPIINWPLESNKDTNFSPKLTLEFRPADDMLVYASATRGFKSGSYNIVNIYTPSNYIKPETVTAFELGAKTEFLDRRVRLNGALFQNEIEDLQVQIIGLTSGGAISLENAGKARTRGVEFDLTLTPNFDAAPGLVMTLSGTYLDAQYLKFPNGSGYDDTTGLFFGPGSLLGPLAPGRDFGGNQITQTAKYTGTASVAYSWELPTGALEASGDFYYNDGFFFTAQNSPHSQQKAYHLINARISYLHEPWNTRLTVFGRNLDNQRYYLYQLHSDFGTMGQLQPEVTYGVRLEWDFY